MHTLTDRMGEDMRLRGFAPKTQQAYRGAVVGLATHFARLPDTLDTLTEAELRAFFLHLVTTRQVSRSTLIVYRSGIRFLYEVTLRRTWPVFDLVRPAKRHVLPVVLAMRRHPKQRAALGGQHAAHREEVAHRSRHNQTAVSQQTVIAERHSQASRHEVHEDQDRQANPTEVPERSNRSSVDDRHPADVAPIDAVRKSLPKAADHRMSNLRPSTLGFDERFRRMFTTEQSVRVERAQRTTRGRGLARGHW